MYYVYFIQNTITFELYVGYTRDLKRRLVEHNTNKSYSTKNKGYWKLIYYESYRNKLPRAKAHGILSTRLDSCFILALGGVFAEEFNKEDALIRENRLKNYGQALARLKKRIIHSLLVTNLVRG